MFGRLKKGENGGNMEGGDYWEVRNIRYGVLREKGRRVGMVLGGGVEEVGEETVIIVEGVEGM
ncbi:hypothetical protein, partial [Paenibacillus sp. Y412MC10]|uniref:hypothetical protein n=1 Tax=Geobacillus sp. (strain Y412MC10) TaxID=481743 RepID=UPI001C92E67F